MSVDLKGYIMSTCTLALQDGPRELGDDMRESMRSFSSGTVMPPGPGALQYALRQHMEGDGLHYTVDVQWAPFVTEWLVRAIPQWQQLVRSRLLAIATPKLQIVELDRRREKALQFKDALIKDQLPTSLQNAIYDIVLDVTYEEMTFDRTWMDKYIREYVVFLMGGRYKW